MDSEISANMAGHGRHMMCMCTWMCGAHVCGLRNTANCSKHQVHPPGQMACNVRTYMPATNCPLAYQIWLSTHNTRSGIECHSADVHAVSARVLQGGMNCTAWRHMHVHVHQCIPGNNPAAACGASVAAGKGWFKNGRKKKEREWGGAMPYVNCGHHGTCGWFQAEFGELFDLREQRR